MRRRGIGLAACLGSALFAGACATKPPGAVEHHPVDRALFSACLPAIVAGEPIETYAAQQGMQPADADTVDQLNTIAGRTFVAVLPVGRVIVGMDGKGICTAAAEDVADPDAVRRSIERFLIAPGSPFLKTEYEEIPGRYPGKLWTYAGMINDRKIKVLFSTVNRSQDSTYIFVLVGWS